MAQRIIYLSWPAREISGGIKMAFRHVEALREAGFDAVTNPPQGFPGKGMEMSDQLQRKRDFERQLGR